jgi:hypothetical protein
MSAGGFVGVGQGGLVHIVSTGCLQRLHAGEAFVVAGNWAA